MHTCVNPSGSCACLYKNLHTCLSTLSIQTVCLCLCLAHTVSSGLCECLWAVGVYESNLKCQCQHRRKIWFNTVPVWSLDSTGNRRFQKTPGTCFLCKHLKKNKHGWEGRGFLFVGLHDVKQDLWSLSPCRTDTYRKREKSKREK